MWKLEILLKVIQPLDSSTKVHHAWLRMARSERNRNNRVCARSTKFVNSTLAGFAPEFAIQYRERTRIRTKEA